MTLQAATDPMRIHPNRLIHFWRTRPEPWRVAIVGFLIARLLYGLWSAIILSIQPLAVQNIVISGEPVLAVFNLNTSQANTYLREINGQALAFRPWGENTMADLQTGSIWNASTGTAVEGHYTGSMLLPSSTSPSRLFPYHQRAPYPAGWLAIWQRFDANWYLSIAEDNYGRIGGDVHFPPLFPALIRLLRPLFGSTFLAGLFIAHLATLYAIKLLYEVYRNWGDALTARRTTALFLLYPTSFFLFSVYSESLFLVAVLLSLRCMTMHDWPWAGFWAFCAFLTRLQGAALVIPMLYLMWSDQPSLRRPVHWFSLALPVTGGLLYLFLRSTQATNDIIPLVEANLHARLVPPWENYWYAVQTLLSGEFAFVDLLNWIVVTLFIMLLAYGWHRIPLAYNLYTTFSLIFVLMRMVETQPLVSMSRYSLTLFPAFFVLSQASDNPWARRLITYAFISLNLYLSAQFFSW
ncbi:MAG TPA: glycosyltransferase family 39 protein, partial [Anaerolineales bacterium]|nr:glycosyltransferase family 39 protein [Anaerolineales bacterium]